MLPPQTGCIHISEGCAHTSARGHELKDRGVDAPRLSYSAGASHCGGGRLASIANRAGVEEHGCLLSAERHEEAP